MGYNHFVRTHWRIKTYPEQFFRLNQGENRQKPFTGPNSSDFKAKRACLMGKNDIPTNQAKIKDAAVDASSRRDAFDLFCACFLGKSQRRVGWQILTAVILFFACREGWITLRERIGQQDDYLLDRNDIVILSRPFWIPPTLEGEAIQNDTKLHGKRMGLLDSSTGEDLVRAFQAHPWVRNVESVRLEYPARAVVSLEFRKPIAFVEHSSRMENGSVSRAIYQVDADGFLLPNDYLTASVASDPKSLYDRLWIFGIASTPVGTYGQPWGDPILDEAVLLAEFLNDDFKALGIQKIVVPNEEKTTEKPMDQKREDLVYRLETVRGKEILWGTFPIKGVIAARNKSKAYYEELKREAWRKESPKLDYLKKLIADEGPLDALPGDRFPLDLSDLTHSGSPDRD